MCVAKCDTKCEQNLYKLDRRRPGEGCGNPLDPSSVG